MIKVNLYTNSGELVVTVTMPPFQIMPDCITWGNRFFFFNPQGIEKKDKSDYYEGFIVAAVPATLDKGKSIGPLHNRKEHGNDDLLFGLPKDLDEAIEDFLGFYEKANDFKIIDDLDEDKFLTTAHHASGQFLRNSWYLWWYQGHEYDNWPKSKPALVQWFNNLGIYHADDMSSIILTSAYRKRHDKALELEKQVEEYKSFWKKQGFADGIYKPK